MCTEGVACIGYFARLEGLLQELPAEPLRKPSQTGSTAARARGRQCWPGAATAPARAAVAGQLLPGIESPQRQPNPMAHHDLPIEPDGKKARSSNDAHSGTQPKGPGPGGRSVLPSCVGLPRLLQSYGLRPMATLCPLHARAIICFDCVPSVISLQDAGALLLAPLGC
jgi:hypothetical protein